MSKQSGANRGIGRYIDRRGYNSDGGELWSDTRKYDASISILIFIIAEPLQFMSPNVSMPRNGSQCLFIGVQMHISTVSSFRFQTFIGSQSYGSASVYYMLFNPCTMYSCDAAHYSAVWQLWSFPRPTYCIFR